MDDNELEEGVDYNDTMEEHESWLEEDGFTEDAADAKDTDEGGNNEVESRGSDGWEDFSMEIESSSMFQDGINFSSSSSSSRNIANIGEARSSNGKKKQCSECQKWVLRLNRQGLKPTLLPRQLLKGEPEYT